MILSSLREIRDFLSESNYFQESVVKSFSWGDILTSVSISMETPQFKVDEPVHFELFNLKFHVIQSFKFIGGMDESRMQYLNKLNRVEFFDEEYWSINEISRIVLDHDSYDLVEFFDQKTQFFRAQFQWERNDKRHIEIIFAKLEVHSKPVDPET